MIWCLEAWPSRWKRETLQVCPCFHVLSPEFSTSYVTETACSLFFFFLAICIGYHRGSLLLSGKAYYPWEDRLSIGVTKRDNNLETANFQMSKIVCCCNFRLWPFCFYYISVKSLPFACLGRLEVAINTFFCRIHVNITSKWTESYPALWNTFNQANTAYGKGKASTKYISAVNNFLATFGRDIFGTHLHFFLFYLPTYPIYNTYNWEHDYRLFLVLFYWFFYLTEAQLWGPYKELERTVEAAIRKKQLDAVHDLEVALKRHKPDFISLLKNPVWYYIYLLSFFYNYCHKLTQLDCLYSYSYM